MLFAEDQHPVGDFGPGCEHEPFRIAFALGLRGGISWGEGPQQVGEAAPRAGAGVVTVRCCQVSVMMRSYVRRAPRPMTVHRLRC
jgi:hypothetical protein